MYINNKFFSKSILVLIGSIAYFAGHSQTIICNDTTKKLYKYSASVFDSNYRIGFDLPNMSERNTPKISEILEAEELFVEKYNSTMRNNKNIYDFVEVRNVKKYFKEYVRQYLAYTNINNEKVVLIQLLNFKVSKTDIERFYKNWETTFIVGHGYFFGINLKMFLVNLNTKELRSF